MNTYVTATHNQWLASYAGGRYIDISLIGAPNDIIDVVSIGEEFDLAKAVEVELTKWVAASR